MVDSDALAQSLATDLIDGRELVEPDLVVLSMPLSAFEGALEIEYALNPTSTFIDVGSVKNEVQQKVQSIPALISRFVPTHPMAGREIGGAGSARADLFVGRTWVVSASSEISADSKNMVLEMIALLGATPFEISAADHDQAVAKVSHLPQIVASLLAKQLMATPQHWLELSGQGLRDTTRIAASDEHLWKEIIFSNKDHIKDLLINLQSDVGHMIDALDSPQQIASIVADGRKGRALIPGKHGGRPREYSYLPIVIDDKPGQLAAIFNECANMSVNVEDLNIEHSPGQLSALITLSLSHDDALTLSNHLASIGWNVHPIRK